MSRAAWVIQYQSGSYRFAPLGQGGALRDLAPGAPTDVAPLAAALTETGYAAQPVLLAIPSYWCMSAHVALASPRLTRNRQALAYALEEQLPLSAEDVVCDFLIQETEALGVAAETAVLLPIVRALEGVEIAISHITPTSLLLLERFCRQRSFPASGVVLLPGSDGCDFFVLERSRPRQWCHLPPDPRHVAQELAAWLLIRSDESVLPVTVVEQVNDVRIALDTLPPDIDVTFQPGDHDQSLLDAARSVLSGGMRTWIELRRDPIGPYDPWGPMRGSLHFLLAALLLSCVAWATSGWIRGEKYEALIHTVENQKQEVFQRLFPESHVPTGIRSRLESERRILAGSSVAGAPAPRLRSAAEFLVDALQALPCDLRFRLLDMRFEEGEAYLEGEVRRHGDVDLIASSLRARGFSVEPPRTEQLSAEGVGFSVHVSKPTTDQDTP